MVLGQTLEEAKPEKRVFSVHDLLRACTSEKNLIRKRMKQNCKGERVKQDAVLGKASYRLILRTQMLKPRNRLTFLEPRGQSFAPSHYSSTGWMTNSHMPRGYGTAQNTAPLEKDQFTGGGGQHELLTVVTHSIGAWVAWLGKWKSGQITTVLP